MGLFQNLCHIYDIVVKQNPEELLPIGFSKQNVHIECLLFVCKNEENLVETNLIEAKLIKEKESMPTILPVTENSSIRTNGPAAHPLFDKLCYISKDCPQYLDSSKLDKKKIEEKKKMFGLYQKELESFLESIREDCTKKVDYDAEKAEKLIAAVHRYLTEKNIIQDLKEAGIITLEEDSEKLKVRTGKKEEDSDLLKLLPPKSGQEDAMVRFSVLFENSEERERLWTNVDIHEAYFSYLRKKEGKKDWCAITGEYAKIAEKHPKSIRMAGDGAKLISSNDKDNYTYRGRFIHLREPNAVSHMASEKMHSALKYLIQKQGFIVDKKVFLHFHSENEDFLKPDMEEINDELAEKEGKIKSEEKLDLTNQIVANQIRHALLGRGEKLSFKGTITTLILDAATPGRLSVLYYNELPDNLFLERIKLWHERSCWENWFFIPDKQKNQKETSPKGKYIKLTRAPTLRSLIDATVGKNADDKLKKEVYQRILVSVVQGQAIPRDLMLMSVRRASQTGGMEENEWGKQLSIACSLYRNYYWQKEDYIMELDTQRTERSYLYGRLLAVADKIERDALYYSRSGDNASEKRASNAWRYMVSFSNSPYRTWNIIFNAVNPYMNQLEKDNPRRALEYQKELAEIYNLFQEKDYESNQSLEGSYLMGFFCQSKKLWEK